MGSQRVGHDWVTNLTSHHLRFVISMVETIAAVMENLDCLRSQPWLRGADHVLEPYSSPLQELLEAQLSKLSRGNDSFQNTKLFEYSERRNKVIQHETFFRGMQALLHKVINDCDMSQTKWQNNELIKLEYWVWKSRSILKQKTEKMPEIHGHKFPGSQQSQWSSGPMMPLKSYTKSGGTVCTWSCLLFIGFILRCLNVSTIIKSKDFTVYYTINKVLN